MSEDDHILKSSTQQNFSRALPFGTYLPTIQPARKMQNGKGKIIIIMILFNINYLKPLQNSLHLQWGLP
ncbi:hypothetical protein AQUCO_03400181v1 [Aquilegia coerulea]|uniref:Uncharacterized protein n=1 Tax=Aquilegia coerulea TaxID=218851 RepID=A0A2G5CXU6_AQUCA|nr:hypothetical protein AQUCO_03400181v1 [Aquilegia coerulea]